MLRTIARLTAAILFSSTMFSSTRSWAAEFIVQPLAIPEMKAVFGRVESRIVVPARARIGGTVREIHVREGDQVKEGQIIARVVDDKLALQLNAANARIEALASQLANARLELERSEQLRASGTGTQARLDQARMQVEVTTNQVAAATAEKTVIEQNAREGEVFAPTTGRVLTVPVTLGSVVLSGEQIVRIAPGPYYLRLSLPERHAAEIVQGTEVLVGARGLTQSPGRIPTARRGRIVQVYPEIADGRVIADVEIESIGDYFVNERTLVSIPVGSRIVLSVPPDAIRTVHGVDYARVVTDNGEMDLAVILGESFVDNGEKRIEVLTGLRAGDRVALP